VKLRKVKLQYDKASGKIQNYKASGRYSFRKVNFRKIKLQKNKAS
jgi:hypothetical protein